MSKIDQLYGKLLSEEVIDSCGSIIFKLAKIETVISDSSVIGNIIQEWLKTFMDKHCIQYRVKQNTQEFPDFLMHDTDDTKELLEVKCFQKSPNFDIANFDGYARSLLNHSYRLDARYLIFEYEMLDNHMKVKDIYLKYVWEIIGASGKSALKIQWKQKRPINIRPTNFRPNASRPSKYPPFTNRKDFVNALNIVIQSEDAGVSDDIKSNWRQRVSDNYRSFTGNDL